MEEVIAVGGGQLLQAGAADKHGGGQAEEDAGRREAWTVTPRATLGAQPTLPARSELALVCGLLPCWADGHSLCVPRPGVMLHDDQGQGAAC